MSLAEICDESDRVAHPANFFGRVETALWSTLITVPFFFSSADHIFTSQTAPIFIKVIIASLTLFNFP